jgi:hypothetical protein
MSNPDNRCLVCAPKGAPTEEPIVMGETPKPIEEEKPMAEIAD